MKELDPKSPKYALLHASRDSRFANAIALDSEARCLLTLWIWDQKENPHGPQLLHGWLMRTDQEASHRWSSVKQENGHVRYRRLLLRTHCNRVLQVLGALLSGKSLSDACGEAKLDGPKDGGALRLETPAEKSRYEVGPVVLLETRDVTLNRSAKSLPLRSPNHAAPGWHFSLYLKDKDTLRQAMASKDGADKASEHVKNALEYLTSETGLDFRGTDAARLGNVDFMVFPAVDTAEQPLVDVNVVSTGNGREKKAEAIRVTVKSATWAPETECLVRCRQRIGHEVASDMARTVSSNDFTTEFPAVEPLGATTVSLFVRRPGQTDWHLLFEQQYHWIRRIGLQMGIWGLKSRVESGLDAGFNSPKWKNRVASIMERTQVHARKSTIGDADTAWETAVARGREMASGLFPRESGAQFFGKGWAQEGRLNFIEWFLSLVRRTNAQAVALIDPFFDTVGVDLLARMEMTQVLYKVITCTQIPSEDDALASEDATGESDKKTRADRILRMCKTLGPVLDTLKIQLWDLRSRATQEKSDKPDQKGKRIFHDRYLLLFDDENRLKCGYHLSNSIQAATKNHPLLVTPIPDDVLDDVFRYVGDLEECNKSVTGEAERVLLYSTLKTDKPRETPAEHPAPSALPGVARLSEVLGVPVGRLQDKGDTAPLSANAISELAKTLAASEEAAFHDLWTAWAFACANDHTLEEANTSLVNGASSSLSAALGRELKNGREYAPPVGVKNLQAAREILLVAHHFREPYAKALDHAKHFLSHSPRAYHLQAWGLKYAAEALVDVDPEGLVAMTGTWMSELDERLDEALSGPTLNVLSIVLVRMFEVLSTRPTERMIQALLGSTSDFLRALGARAVAEHRDVTVETGIQWLNGLRNNRERILALAEWTSDLRVEANRSGGQESEDVAQRRKKLMSELADRWQGEEKPGELLGEIFERVSGPMKGSWARSTLTDLFLPLMNRGVLTAKEVADELSITLFDRIGSHFPSTKGQGRRQQYYSPTDGEFTDVTAWLLTQVRPELRKTYVTNLKKAMDVGWPELHRPFAQSIDYEKWSGARDGLRWATSFLGLLWLHGREAGLDAVDLTELHEEVEEKCVLLDKHPDQYPDSTGLVELLISVRRQIRALAGA